MSSLVKSKQRVADHGEVFTPRWMVEAMLDLVKDETERIDSRFLEPACGSGNFLVPVLRRKLAAVELKYGKTDFEKRHYALLGADVHLRHRAARRQRRRVPRRTCWRSSPSTSASTETTTCYRAAAYVLSQNIVHGDALTMRTSDGAADHLRRVGLPRQGQVPAARLPLRHAHPDVRLRRGGHALRRPRQARDLHARPRATRR